MQLIDWILSATGAVIAILLGVTAYFAQKWIQQIEETIKEQSVDIKNLTTQVGSLKQTQTLTAEDIHKAIQTHLSSSKISLIQFDRIEKEIAAVKAVVQEKLLPQAEKTNAELGRVIVLENQLREQESKLNTMFSALKALAKLQNSQRPK